MVGISTLLNFIQEARSTKAADALKAMVSNTATVLRVVNEQGESRWCELPIDQLVPGDIVKLSAGYDPGGPAHHSGARSVSSPRPR
jgi:Mg2+-importing ATPase